MKGKKICSCGEIVGARTLKCKCGKAFTPANKVDKKKEVKSSEEEFKGGKQCLKCEKFVSKKSKRCVCGIAFKSHEYRALKNAVIKEQRDKQKNAQNYDVKARIFAENVGYGNSPIVFATGNLIKKPPLSTAQEDVIDWVRDNLLDEENRLRYISVFVSSLSRLLPIGDYKTCYSHLKKWWKENES